MNICFVQITNLFEQWACGSLQSTRVFTDQWPDCTCVVMCYQFESPGLSDSISISYVGRPYGDRAGDCLSV